MLFKILFPLILIFSNAYSFNRLKVIVTIEPYQYLVQRIGKRKVKVVSLYKDSKIINNHSQFELRKYAKYHLYLQSGLKNEKEFYLKFLSFNNNIKKADISFNIRKIKNQNNMNNEFIWLDPLNLRLMANNILFELVKIDKRNEKYYTENYEVLLKEIDTLYLRIKTLYNKSQKKSVYIFDSKWQYFSKRFDLNFYTREKEIIKSFEFSKIKKFTAKNNVQLCLTKPGFDYNILSSLINNTKLKSIEHDVYKYSLLSNIYKLSILLFSDKNNHNK